MEETTDDDTGEFSPTVEARILEGPPIGNDGDESQLFLKVHTGVGTLVMKISTDEVQRLQQTAEHPQPLHKRGRSNIVEHD